MEQLLQNILYSYKVGAAVITQQQEADKRLRDLYTKNEREIQGMIQGVITKRQASSFNAPRQRTNFCPRDLAADVRDVFRDSGQDLTRWEDDADRKKRERIKSGAASLDR